MGTEITLDVADVSVTYSKNHRGFDHGSIFQEQDRKPVKGNQLDNDRCEEEGEDPKLFAIAGPRRVLSIIPK